MAGSARSVQKNGPDKTQAVIDAITNYDLVGSPSWGDLELLSTHTQLDGMEVDPEGIVFEQDNHFRGVLNVYVLLEYASKTEGEFKTADAFLASFKGHFEKGDRPVIDTITVDTSPFYEGESEAS